MVKLFVDAGIIAITAFISPYSRDRRKIRDLVGKGRFFEIHVDCPIDVCAERDQKGIYEKAKAGIIKNFTGISAPYEPPENPEMVIQSAKVDATKAAKKVLELMTKKKII
jgi:adenylylsulfate kinase-like enzyme